VQLQNLAELMTQRNAGIPDPVASAQQQPGGAQAGTPTTQPSRPGSTLIDPTPINPLIQPGQQPGGTPAQPGTQPAPTTQPGQQPAPTTQPGQQPAPGTQQPPPGTQQPPPGTQQPPQQPAPGGPVPQPQPRPRLEPRITQPQQWPQPSGGQSLSPRTLATWGQVFGGLVGMMMQNQQQQQQQAQQQASQQNQQRPPIQPSVNLFASPNPVTRGATSTLFWTGVSVQSCAIFATSSAPVAMGGPSGSKEFKILETTQFTARCQGQNGATVEDRAEVRIQAQ
jgi:hypothetical protein